MIERFMDCERPYGEPQYSQLSKQISSLCQQLNAQLDKDGQILLEHLSSAYIRQGNTMLPDAYADGFWTAVELMLEFYRWKQF